MRSAIWKFSLPIDDSPVLSMPDGAKVLSIQDPTNGSLAGGGMPLAVWAMVDIDAPFVDRQFHVLGTGHPADRVLPLDPHIATVVTMGGALVWHIFDGGRV